jgi:hypothetical protein
MVVRAGIWGYGDLILYLARSMCVICDVRSARLCAISSRGEKEEVFRRVFTHFNPQIIPVGENRKEET